MSGLTDRAYLPAGRIGAAREALSTALERILDAFAAAGAERVEPPALLPAELLLDLYGEDIRSRAYVVADPVAGELVLRPDFTLPVVRMHIARGAAPARYAYGGMVWRAQEPGSTRPNEYLQAGIEAFGDADPAAADAEIFALIAGLVDGEGTTVETGDMGVLAALVDGLETVPHRRAALRRHLWRPARFRRLLELFGSAHADLAARRADLLAAVAERGVAACMAEAGCAVGLRDEDDIARRIERLRLEAETPPLSPDQTALMEAVLAVSAPMGAALARLRELAPEAPGLGTACDRIEARMAALGRRGIAAEELAFSTSFGRTTLEYYDGFVFGFSATDRPDLPPLASGGRYDGLTRALGGGQGVPAVGAILRPEALLAAGRGA